MKEAFTQFNNSWPQTTRKTRRQQTIIF